MRYRSVVGAAALSLALISTDAAADLIFIGGIDLAGQGIGSVDTVLTIQSQGAATTESGCVAAGIGGTTITGAAACPAGFAGGDEQAGNTPHSATSLGLTDFADLRIIFNPVEPSSPAGEPITLDLLSLTLWDPDTGLILGAFNTAGPVVFPTTNPGVGNAGFGFELDAIQMANANLLLAAFPDLFLGLAANASDATGGPETFSFGVAESVEPPPIGLPQPETLFLLGFGLLVLAMLSRRREV